MKKWFAITLIQLLSYAAFAQQENANWYTGHGVENGRTLKWQNGNLVLTDSTILGTKETTASVSDKNGNLLFYTNGCKIYNRLHEPMLNGDEIPCMKAYWFTPMPNTESLGSGSEMTNGAIIVNDPSDSNRYYLFATDTWTAVGLGEDFYCTVIDMTLDGGLGGVVTPVSRVLDSVRFDAIGAKVTAVRHANGRDWWILNSVTDTWLATPDQTTTAFIHGAYIKRYLLSPAGITDTLSMPYCRTPSDISMREGEIAVNATGDKLALIHVGKSVVVMDFNRCTGLISDCRIIDTLLVYNPFDGNGNLFWGVEFSKSSQFLYVSTGNKIYQYNLHDTVPAATRYLVDSHNMYTLVDSTRRTWSEFQMGMDDKIYYSLSKFQYWKFHPVDTPTLWLRRIENPDSLGAACLINNHAVYLGVQSLGLPNLANWNLGVLEGSECDTVQTVTANYLTEDSFVASLFPNPAADEVTLVLNKPSPDAMELVLHDVLGKEVQRVAVPKNEKYTSVSLVALPQGVYLYRLGNGRNVLSQGKLVVSR